MPRFTSRTGQTLAAASPITAPVTTALATIDELDDCRRLVLSTISNITDGWRSKRYARSECASHDSLTFPLRRHRANVVMATNVTFNHLGLIKCRMRPIQTF